MPRDASKPPSRAANGLRAVPPARRAPGRIEPLSALPVFAKLDGRPVLVVGGEEGAAWKAELLAAAGARVTMVLGGADAEGFGEAALEIAARVPALRLDPRPWEARDLWGRAAPDATGVAPDRPALALIDTECHGEAAAFATLGRAAGVTVNCIDKPAHCEVQFGSIVNRSPVVVGISTDGAAPILGQAIRRRVEALLPPAIRDWGALLAKGRAGVLSRLPDRAARRRFFERVADLAFRAPAPERLDALVGEAGRERGGGHVTLVGAGPGDASLLTVKAVRALQSADVILFDALVSDEVLELARREAKRMLVGKRGGRDSCRQEEINALMLQLAGEGRRVVRLKSGDPMVFGRAGEEIDALRAAAIPHEVVPGVTAAQALAAEAKVSLTHRAEARSVRFVTGHGRDGRLPADLDWRGLADPGTTLAVYMGARTAPLLAARLLGEGADPETPVLAASAVSRAGTRRWRGPLSSLEAGVATLDADAPILIAIGAAMGRAEGAAPALAASA